MHILNHKPNPNHKPRKSILVKFEFFTPQCIKTAVLSSPKFGGETLTIKQNKTT